MKESNSKTIKLYQIMFIGILAGLAEVLINQVESVKCERKAHQYNTHIPK